MPQAAGIISLIGSVAGGASQYQSGQDAAAIGRNNAILANEQADETLRQGVQAQNQYRTRLRQFMGRQRALTAANNVQNMGSPLALQEDAASLGEADIANIRNQAALDAWGFRTGAQQALQKGRAAESTANLSAFGSLLKAGGQAYDIYGNRPIKPKVKAQAPILGADPAASGYGWGAYA